MSQKIMCPICNKRALDILELFGGQVVIEMKCPHCRKIVKINYKSNKKMNS